MRIAQITDLHLDDGMASRYEIDSRGHFLTILDDIAKGSFDLIVLTGDLGSPRSLAWMFGELSRRNLRAKVVFGNHDHWNDFQPHPEVMDFLVDGFLYYRQKINGMTFLFLDSSREILDQRQLDWIGDQLKFSVDSPVGIFIHHPILAFPDSPMDKLYALKNREPLEKMLSDFPHQVSIFSGHYHHAYEVGQANIQQFVTMASILQVKTTGEVMEFETASFGYRVLELAEDKISTRMVVFDPSGGKIRPL